MHGHQHLIAMRLKGQVPAHGVMVETDDEQRGYVDDLNSCGLGVWHVHIPGADRLSMLDLRPFAGLQVFVNGSDTKRVQQVGDAIAAAGAERVVASTFRWSGQRAQLVTLTDTKGVMTWPQ